MIRSDLSNNRKTGLSFALGWNENNIETQSDRFTTAVESTLTREAPGQVGVLRNTILQQDPQENTTDTL